MISKSKIRKRAEIFKNDDINAHSKKTSALVPMLLMLPALILFLLFLIIPLLSVMKDSMVNINTDESAWRRLFNDKQWWYSVEYSFVYSVSVLAVSLSLSIVVSFILSGMISKRLRGFWQTLFFIPYVTSIVAMSIVFSIIFDRYGVINSITDNQTPWLTTRPGEGVATLFAMFIFGVWQSMAFQILILVTAMLAVDKRLYQVADIDGIPKHKQLSKITLPQISKTINYLILIGLITCLKTFSLGLFQNNITTAMKYGPTMLLYIYDSVSSGAYDKAGAASIMMIVFIVILQYGLTYAFSFISGTRKSISKKLKDKKIEKFEKMLEVQNE